MYILAFEEIFDSASDNVLIFDLELLVSDKTFFAFISF